MSILDDFQLDGKIVKYNCRLYGIDTPEMRPRRNNPNREAEKKAAKKCFERRQKIDSLSTYGKKRGSRKATVIRIL